MLTGPSPPWPASSAAWASTRIYLHDTTGWPTNTTRPWVPSTPTRRAPGHGGDGPVSIAESCPAWIPKNESHREWAVLSAEAPQLAATMRRYLVQLTTFSRLAAWTWPTRHCASWPGGWWRDPRRGVVSDITRTHVEDYKVWLAAQPGCTVRPWPEHPASAAADDPDLFERLSSGTGLRPTIATDPPRGHPTPVPSRCPVPL